MYWTGRVIGSNLATADCCVENSRAAAEKQTETNHELTALPTAAAGNTAVTAAPATLARVLAVTAGDNLIMLVWCEEISAEPGDRWPGMQGRDSTATAGETAAGTTLRHPPVTVSDQQTSLLLPCNPSSQARVHYILLSRTGPCS